MRHSFGIFLLVAILATFSTTAFATATPDDLQTQNQELRTRVERLERLLGAQTASTTSSTSSSERSRVRHGATVEDVNFSAPTEPSDSTTAHDATSDELVSTDPLPRIPGRSDKVTSVEHARLMELAKSFSKPSDKLLGPLFADVPDEHPFRWQIESFYWMGITGGCATDPLRFCPDSKVTRAQMAVYMVRLNDIFASWFYYLESRVVEGACCRDDGTCAVMSRYDCFNYDGRSASFFGEGSDCEIPCGACCSGYSDGYCYISKGEEDCEYPGSTGTYQGDGMVCDFDADLGYSTCGACCLTGMCTDATTTNCSDGSFGGSGTSCGVEGCPP